MTELMKSMPILMEQDAINRHFMQQAERAAMLSKDRRRKVGCVLISASYRFLVKGYNDFPFGLIDDVEARHQKPEKYFWTEHAERNAIYNAARAGIHINHCRAYVNFFPCVDCTRGLIQVGMIELISYRPDFESKWGELFRKSAEILEACGIPVTFMDKEMS